MSADGEQVEDDADRIHKRAEDLEQFIRDTLLGAKGSRNEHYLPSINYLHILPTYIILNVRDPCGKFKLLHWRRVGYIYKNMRGKK